MKRNYLLFVNPVLYKKIVLKYPLLACRCQCQTHLIGSIVSVDDGSWKLGRVSQIPYLLTLTKVAWNLTFLCAKNYLRLFLNEIAMAFFACIELKRPRKRNFWPIPTIFKGLQLTSIGLSITCLLNLQFNLRYNDKVQQSRISTYYICWVWVQLQVLGF